jgi:hypothetical protein
MIPCGVLLKMGDLYLLVDDELLVALPEGQTPENIQTEAGTAMKSHDFDRVLELLRFGPPRIPDVGIAYLRSRCYEQLGMHVAALNDLARLRATVTAEIAMRY